MAANIGRRLERIEELIRRQGRLFAQLLNNGFRVFSLVKTAEQPSGLKCLDNSASDC